MPTEGNLKRVATEPRTLSVLIFGFSALALLVHLLTNSRYGYFRDELYYMACGRHLAFGYVDQPPLSIALLRLSQLLFGDSLFAIRLFPALAGAGTVALAGMIARELGGRAWAVALSCAAALCAPFYLSVGNFFSMNAFEPLCWMGCIYLLVRIINEPAVAGKLWLWFGAILGLGLENKHSTAFFAAGILAGLLLTPERRHFARKWIWLGGLVAFAMAHATRPPSQIHFRAKWRRSGVNSSPAKMPAAKNAVECLFSSPRPRIAPNQSQSFPATAGSLMMRTSR